MRPGPLLRRMPLIHSYLLRSYRTTGRSGLFLRPGGNASERQRMLKVGSSYRNLVRDVIPLLPTLAQAARPSNPTAPRERRTR